MKRPIYSKTFNFYFGTNEVVNYEDISHLEADLVYKKISEQEYLIFERLNLLNVGVNPYYSLMNHIEEECELEDCGQEDENHLYQAHVEPKVKPERKIEVPTDEEVEELMRRLKRINS